MTKTQFLDYFYIQMDKVATNALGSFDPQEVSILGTEALESLVRERITPKNNRKQEGLEQTEKRVEDLAELIRYKTINTFTVSSYFPNAINATLPNTLLSNSQDYSDVHWFTIYEACEINLDDCYKPATENYKRVKILERSHQEINMALEDPFNKPNADKVLRLRSEGKIVTLVHAKGYDIVNYIVGYIKKPKPLDLTSNLTDSVCELSDHMHMELVNKTVEMALKRIESPRLPTEIQTNLE